MFHLVAKTEDLSIGHSLSDNSKRLLWRGKDGARIIYEFLPQRPCSQDIKRFKKNQTSQVSEFCAFLCIKRPRV